MQRMIPTKDGKKRGSFLSWIREAWSVKQRHPLVGSNRDLALVLLRFLVLLTMFSSAFMAITGSLLSDVSDISAGGELGWPCDIEAVAPLAGIEPATFRLGGKRSSN